MIEIPITKGYTALVSDEDADLVNYKWWANRKKAHSEHVYVARNIGGRKNKTMIHMHRIIVERKIGRSLEKGEIVDHCDRNPLNNQRDNLRVCTMSQNNQNKPIATRSKTGYIGVSWSKQHSKYEAYIALNKRRKHVGLFVDPVEAARARDRKAIELYGEFASLNFDRTTYEDES